MAQAHVYCRRGIREYLLKVLELAGGFVHFNPFAVPECYPGGIVSPVLQSFEAVNDHLNRSLFPYIADYAAHGVYLLMQKKITGMQIPRI